MIELPVSDYVRSYYKEHNVELTDFEKAHVFWDSPNLAMEDTLEALAEIAKTTSDGALKVQIEERLAYERQGKEWFLDNHEGKAIYKLSVYEDGSGEYYFTDFGKAIEYGTENCEEDFVYIRKIALDVMDDSNKLGWGCWDKEGKLLDSRWVCQFYDEIYAETMDERFNNHQQDRFEMAYLPMIYPFEKGDIVRDRGGEIGVIGVSWEEQRESAERGRKAGLPLDSSDRMIIVYSVDPNTGKLEYGHADYLYLDKVMGFDREAEAGMMKCISRILLGKETNLTDFYYYRDEYKENYRI